MSILVDHEIAALCAAGGVEGYDAALINPASLDVRLGERILIESVQSPDLVPYPLHHHDEGNPYLWQPGQFILAHTQEILHMPDDLVGEFRLKSSRAREGVDQALAIWIDPGYHGSSLTLELRNNRQLHPIPIWCGMRIGQLVWHRLSAKPTNSYRDTGRYNGRVSVQGSLG